eukprot:TRINITY_DN26988_c0_g1_i2.p3 TRINITY_DN26988_c0_g1~~TRINITY_DN26988_c0_g1_i2.p3  ORF type:complete len:141 (-),score=22.00 TRINITY_DN26988_c0_g1_i2:48-470(-)
MCGRSWASWLIYKMYSSIPIDYEFLHEDVDKNCLKSTHVKWQQILGEADMTAFVKSKPTFSQRFALAKMFAGSSTCGTEYLGAGHDEASPSFEIDNSHGYDFLEGAVWAHAWLEMPAKIRMKVLASKEWNYIHGVNKQGK